MITLQLFTYVPLSILLLDKKISFLLNMNKLLIEKFIINT